MGSRTEKCCGACRGGWWPRTNPCSAPNAACASPSWLLKRTANYSLMRRIHVIATLSERNFIMDLEQKLWFPVSPCPSPLWERFPIWGAGDQTALVSGCCYNNAHLPLLQSCPQGVQMEQGGPSYPWSVTGSNKYTTEMQMGCIFFPVEAFWHAWAPLCIWIQGLLLRGGSCSAVMGGTGVSLLWYVPGCPATTL